MFMHSSICRRKAIYTMNNALSYITGMITEENLSLLKENNIFIHPDETLLWVGQPSRKCYKKKSKEREMDELPVVMPLIAVMLLLFILAFRQPPSVFWTFIVLCIVIAVFWINSSFNRITDLERHHGEYG